MYHHLRHRSQKPPGSHTSVSTLFEDSQRLRMRMLFRIWPISIIQMHRRSLSPTEEAEPTAWLTVCEASTLDMVMFLLELVFTEQAGAQGTFRIGRQMNLQEVIRHWAHRQELEAGIIQQTTRYRGHLSSDLPPHIPACGPQHQHEIPSSKMLASVQTTPDESSKVLRRNDQLGGG